MSEICKIIHNKINSLPRFSYPFNNAEIPKNGIYFLFQKNEHSHSLDRIVLVATHTGKNNLSSRINEHFVTKNKDRSIFRKQIGRALLNKNRDPFIAEWNIDLTRCSAKEMYENQISKDKILKLENLVSEYIQENFSFAVLPMETKDNRMFWKSRLIAEISNCEECRPSKEWFGFNCLLENISKSGLWQTQHTKDKPMNTQELECFLSLCNTEI